MHYKVGAYKGDNIAEHRGWNITPRETGQTSAWSLNT